MSDVVARCFRDGEWNADELANLAERLNEDNERLKAELAQAKRLLRNIVSNLHCNEDIDQELYDAAEFLKGTSGRTPDRPAITN